MKEKESGRSAPPGYSRFVREALALLPAARRVHALRITSAEWVSQLRQMLTRSSSATAEGTAIFYHLELMQPRSAKRDKVARAAAAAKAASTSASLLTHWTHPSLVGLPVAESHADSATEQRRRDAEALILSALRFCDCAEPLDSVVLDVSLLEDFTALSLIHI